MPKYAHYILLQERSPPKIGQPLRQQRTSRGSDCELASTTSTKIGQGTHPPSLPGSGAQVVLTGLNMGPPTPTISSASQCNTSAAGPVPVLAPPAAALPCWGMIPLGVAAYRPKLCLQATLVVRGWAPPVRRLCASAVAEAAAGFATG